jgi:hypothetical protein
MDNEYVRQALALTASAPLSPPQHKLLSCFVKDSVSPAATAQYLLKRISHGNEEGVTTESTLREILAD